MKQIILPFLILAVSPFMATAYEMKSNIVQKPDSALVSDSLELFRNLTDISKQVERRAAKSVAASSVTVATERRQSPASDSVARPSVVIPKGDVVLVPFQSATTYGNPLDSLYTRSPNGTLQLPYNYSGGESMYGLTFQDTLFYNPLFLPMIFTGEMLPRELSLYPREEDTEEGVLIPREKTFAPQLDHVDFVRKVRRNYYLTYPDRIKYSASSFDSIPKHMPEDKVVKESFNPFRELLKAETNFSLEAPGVEGVNIGRKYWVRSGEHSFQFAQNYFSENWHKGGVNNLNFNSLNIFRANYKKDKVKFNNTLEWRLSVFNSPDDSLRKYRIGNDLIRYYGDFGVDAFVKGWSYSMNLEAKSQMFKSYPVNSNDLRSAFGAPLYVNSGIGLKYNLEKKSDRVRHRKVKWELAISPASINYTYVMNDKVDVKRFGIEEGKRSELDLGSTLTSILKYDFTRYVTWDSRLSYFTSYDKVISEFENSLNLSLSNAFSTRIYLNMRFDDSVPKDPDFKHLQINQTLSFGLNYKW